MTKKFIYPMQDTSTYHLDQRVRGLISKNRINQKFLDKYYPEKYEAVLPLSILEYIGIKPKKVLFEISPPKLSESLDLQLIKEHFDKQIESNLSKNDIEEKLKERLKYDENYAEPFIKSCLDALSRPGFYELIVDQLSWDRFSYLAWIKNNSKVARELRINIAKMIIKCNHLYILRHCEYLSKIKTDFSLNEDQKFLMKSINETKIKPNMDIGDCELIHVAINGQSSANFKKRKLVDCYTMDNPEEIKNRLTSCIYFYQILKSYFGYKFDSTYFGKIYIVDEKGREKEEINVADYEPRNRLIRKKYSKVKNFGKIKY